MSYRRHPGGGFFRSGRLSAGRLRWERLPTACPAYRHAGGRQGRQANLPIGVFAPSLSSRASGATRDLLLKFVSVPLRKSPVACLPAGRGRHSLSGTGTPACAPSPFMHPKTAQPGAASTLRPKARRGGVRFLTLLLRLSMTRRKSLFRSHARRKMGNVSPVPDFRLGFPVPRRPLDFPDLFKAPAGRQNLAQAGRPGYASHFFLSICVEPRRGGTIRQGLGLPE
jgi:hypothetical protein